MCIKLSIEHSIPRVILQQIWNIFYCIYFNTFTNSLYHLFSHNYFSFTHFKCMHFYVSSFSLLLYLFFSFFCMFTSTAHTHPFRANTPWRGGWLATRKKKTKTYNLFIIYLMSENFTKLPVDNYRKINFCNLYSLCTIIIAFLWQNKSTFWQLCHVTVTVGLFIVSSAFFTKSGRVTWIYQGGDEVITYTSILRSCQKMFS